MAPIASLAPALAGLSSAFARLPNVTFGSFEARQYTPSDGSCGWTNSSSEFVVSIKINSTRSNDAFCGQEVEVETETGSVVATIVDTCLSCGYDYLGVSKAAFSKISEDETERVAATYTFTDKKHGSSEKKENESPKKSNKSSSSSSSSSKQDWTPSSSSKTAEYTPSSSSKNEWTPSSSSKTPEWTPSSSSSSSKTPEWTPEWTPSSSSKTPEWTPSSSSKQAEQTPKAQQSYGGYSGQATYFYQGGNPGACGNYNNDGAYIVALDYRMYGGGSHCGQSVRITNNNNGNTITATVADMCPSCSSSGSLDLSVGAFQALGSMDAGVLPISWSWA